MSQHARSIFACVWLTVLGVLLVSGCAHAPTPSLSEMSDAGEPASSTQSSNVAHVDQMEMTNDRRTTRSLTISLDRQQFTYSVDGETRRTGPISSGAPGYPTPTGRFAVLGKDRDKVSSRYTNQLGMQAWMPYSIQFHGHYFLHEGWLPGYPDSHGCVRVGEQDARFLFEQMRLGDRIDVVN